MRSRLRSGAILIRRVLGLPSIPANRGPASVSGVAPPRIVAVTELQSLQRQFEDVRQRTERVRQQVADVQALADRVRAREAAYRGNYYRILGERAGENPVSLSEAVSRAGEAESRANALLISLLSPIQLRQYKTSRAFAVIGSEGGRYLISADSLQVFGDLPYDSGHSGFGSFCYQSLTTLPHSDRLLSWKLWLEGNEPKFREKAIPTRRYEGHAASRRMLQEMAKELKPKGHTWRKWLA